MSIKELAETLKSRPGMRIRITHVSLSDEDGNFRFTPALTDAQIIAYQDRVIAWKKEDGNTVYCTVV